MKELKFDFYRVMKGIDGKAFFDLGPVLRKIHKRTLEARSHVSGGDAYRLGHLSVEGNTFIGDFLRINMDQPAMVAGVKTEERAVTTAADEGISTSVVFLYDAQKHAIVFQRAKGGVSAVNAAIYLGDKDGDGAICAFEPILRRDVATMLQKMKNPRRVEFSANVAGLRKSDAQSDAMSKVIDLSTDTGSRRMALVLSAGQKQDSTLNSGGILEFIKDAMRLRSRGAEVKRMSLKADFGSDSGQELLDLLDASLTAKQYIQPTRNAAEYFTRRVDAVRKAWHEHVRDV